MIRSPWCRDAAQALLPTLDGELMENVKNDVERGSLTLWKYRKNWIVTEHCPTSRTLHVWAVSGADLLDSVHAIVAYARLLGCERLRYRSRHRGVTRMARGYSPMLTDARNKEYTICL